MIGKNIAGDIDSVFVYGTLMPGGTNEHIAQQAGKYRAEKAYIEGMLLFDLAPEGYPGIIPKHIPQAMYNALDSNPTGRVDGYLLRFDDITLALTLFDELEDCYLEPPLYNREIITVQPSGTLAWVYIYAQHDRLERPGTRLISTGKWQSKT